jgi:hypothetical protein
MALRAKKPEVKPARVKALIYADKGVGKTHFCCSFPNAYYIDTEGLQDYPQFVEMIRANNSDLVYLTELSEIIKEVKELLSTKHDYRTLIIDSLSFPYGWIAQLEADRLIEKDSSKEGTEYGANLAKGKRLIFQLGILLSRLDMNVIVVAHEKMKFADNKETGKTYDISDKMAYSLGSVWQMKLMGKSRKLFIEKTRYKELKTSDHINFDDGFNVLKSLFSEEIFVRKSNIEELATPEQVKSFNHLIQIFNVPTETIQKWLINTQATEIENMPRKLIQEYIDKLNARLTTFNETKGETHEIHA